MNVITIQMNDGNYAYLCGFCQGVLMVAPPAMTADAYENMKVTLINTCQSHMALACPAARGVPMLGGNPARGTVTAGGANHPVGLDMGPPRSAEPPPVEVELPPMDKDTEKLAVKEAAIQLHLYWPVLYHSVRGCDCKDCEAKFAARYNAFVEEFEAARNE